MDANSPKSGEEGNLDRTICMYIHKETPSNDENECLQAGQDSCSSRKFPYESYQEGGSM